MKSARRGQERRVLGRAAIAALGLLSLCLLAAAEAGATAQVTFNSASAAAGDSFEITANLSSGPADQLAAVSVDLYIDATTVVPGTDCQLGAGAIAAGKQIIQNELDGFVRIGVLGLNSTRLPNGELFRCRFFSNPTAAPGSYPITAEAGASTVDGVSAAVTAASATLTITEAMPSDGDGDGVFQTPGLAFCVDGATAGCSDNCPTESNPSQADQDGDGVGDACDVCIEMADPRQNGVQLDTDRDGYGNACDCDLDNDGDCDLDDMGIFVPAFSAGVDPGIGADMTGDGEVSMRDFGRFLSSYASGAPGPSGQAQ